MAEKEPSEGARAKAHEAMGYGKWPSCRDAGCPIERRSACTAVARLIDAHTLKDDMVEALFNDNAVVEKVKQSLRGTAHLAADVQARAVLRIVGAHLGLDDPKVVGAVARATAETREGADLKTLEAIVAVEKAFAPTTLPTEDKHKPMFDDIELLVLVADHLRVHEGRPGWSTNNLPGKDVATARSILATVDHHVAKSKQT